jgi:hypothetical protein
MKAYDQLSSLFWLIISVYVFGVCLYHGIGTIRNPGMYFMAFGASGILGGLSLIQFFQSAFTKEPEVPAHPFSGKMWGKVVFVLIVLFVYAKALLPLGYLLSTFFLMSLLFLIVRKGRWWWALVSAGSTSLLTYVLFSKTLGCEFPRGLFGF